MTVQNRLRLGISYVSLAVAGSLIAPAVQAADRVITTAETAPVATSRADGTSPGNLTISPTGSVKVGSGTAVSVDSSHNFTNNGTIESTADAGGTGIRFANNPGRGFVGTLTDNGIINIPGPAQSSPLWAQDIGSVGISVTGVYNVNSNYNLEGSIVRGAGSVMTVGGNGATGILYATSRYLTGSLINDGNIKVTRQDSYGIRTLSYPASGILGSIFGELRNGGIIEATGQDGIGIYSGVDVGGAITNSGTILTGAPASGSGDTAVSAIRGGRALWVAGDAGGIFLQGNGVTKELEPTTLIPEGTPADSLLSVRGSAEALFVGQGGENIIRNITVGALAGNANGASIVNRGNIAVESAVKISTPVRAVNITGTLIGTRTLTTTLAGGFRNEGGDITAFGKDSPSQAIRIGDYASVPSLFNSGLIHAQGVDSGENATTGVSGAGGGDAYGVIIEAGGRLPALVNTGKIHADSRGVTYNAYGIIDYSGTLTSVVNDGIITATRRGTGTSIALDLSRATSAVTVRNTGTLVGATLFGASADSFTSTGGIILGNMSMGAGNDTVAMTGTTFTGTLDLGEGAHTVTLANTTLEGSILLGTGGTANLDVSGGSITLPTTSGINVTNGRIYGGTALNFNINATDETVGGIKAAGLLTIEAGTTLKTTIVGAVVDQFTVNLLEAGTLVLNADLSGLQPGSTVMYQRQIKRADTNANILQYQITRRTAAQLGLTPILGSIYDNSVAGMGQDTEFAGVMASFTEQAKFEAALAEMVPDTSDAARRIALSSRVMAEGALQRRLSGFLSNRNDPLGRFRSGFWLQALSRFGSGDSQGAIPGYSTFSAGVAAGVDATIDDEAIIGMSLAQTFGSAEEKGRNTDPVKLSTTSLDFYGRWNSDIAYVQGTIGYGFNSYKQSRTVEFETIARQTSGKSPGYQWGATVDVGSHLVTGATILTGYLRTSYNNIYRHAFSEDGGGPAVDLRYDSRSYDSIRAGGGVAATHRISFSASNAIALTARASYAHEFSDKATAVDAQFVASGTKFTLTGLTPASNILGGGVGVAWERRLSTLSFDYDADKAGPFLGHSLSLTYRQRF